MRSKLRLLCQVLFLLTINVPLVHAAPSAQVLIDADNLRQVALPRTVHFVLDIFDNQSGTKRQIKHLEFSGNFGETLTPVSSQANQSGMTVEVTANPVFTADDHTFFSCSLKIEQVEVVKIHQFTVGKEMLKAPELSTQRFSTNIVMKDGVAATGEFGSHNSFNIKGSFGQTHQQCNGCVVPTSQ